MRLTARATKNTLPLYVVAPDGFEGWLKGRPASDQGWLEANRVTGKAGQVGLLPGTAGIAGAVAIVEDDGTPWAYAHLPGRLGDQRFELATKLSAADAERLCLGWGLASYVFDRYKDKKSEIASLVWPQDVDRARVTRLVEATALARDLVNTPAGDLGPAELAAEAKKLAEKHGAKIKVIEGKALERGWPAVYAVGKGSPRAPKVVDLTWGRPKDPKVTLVGKGVCFDSGGLNLKPTGGMLLMKKDMGGSAQVLGLAHAIMDAKLPVRLRVLVPTVENAISGEAFHPLDVIRTRKGITVEIGNTDAEGRLILCDALHEASKEEPELILDFATLTGAARVALGTDVPALFASDDRLAEDLLAACEASGDPLWRMPLWKGYRSKLDSQVADINNVAEGGYGGAITAALFLQEFVDEKVPWAHVDLMAYNLSNRPGRPKGGEAMGVRAAYTMLETRYPPKAAAKKKGTKSR